MKRRIFDAEHEQFRHTARTYFEKECVPHTKEWERDGRVSRQAWLRAGEQGLIGWELPEEYGGLGIKDFRYNAILTEEFHASGATGLGLTLLNDVFIGYLSGLTTDEQEQRWIPGCVAGEIVPAIAMSEPGACPTYATSPPRHGGRAIATS